MVDHHFAVDVLHATVGVTDDQDLGDTQLNDADEQAADHASERIRHDTARIFDHLHVSVPDTKRCRKQFNEPCIHAGQNRDLLVRIFAGSILLITFFFHKFFVVGKHFFNHVKSPFAV